MMVTIHNKSAVDAIIANDKHKKEDGSDITDYADFIAIEEWDKKDPVEWQFEKATADTSANTVTLEYRYYQKVDGYNEEGKKEALKLPALFSKLVIPGTLSTAELEALKDGGFKIVVTGHAIQAAGFEDQKDDAGTVIKSAEDMAWAAFEEELEGADANAGN